MDNYIPFGAPGAANGGIDGGDFSGNIAGGQFIFTNVDEFRKAVTAGASAGQPGYSGDVATLTGGSALRLQSIEPTLLRTIQEDKHFVFFNKVSTSNAGATLDEYTIKSAIGGYPGSGFNSELGDIPDTQGQYDRKVGLVKFLMTKREVSVVQQSQKTLVDTIAEEKVDAARELKTSVEWGSFYGDSTVNPLEFDGLLKVANDTNDSDLIKDVRGQGLSYVAQEIIDATAAVASYGRFGNITDFFCSYAVKASELDQKLDPAFRVGTSGNQKVGTPVDGIKTSHGEITVNQDVFIQESQMPFEARPAPFPAVTSGAYAPAPVLTCTAAAGANANSQFGAAHAGNYYYGVEPVARNGRGTTFVTAVQAVASGDRVTLTITNPTENANTITGYVIYRSRRNGTNAKSDLREIARIARTGAAGATMTFTDDNKTIPGTSVGFLVSLAPGANAVTLRRLLPMTMFPLYPTSKATRPWAQLLFCYLRVAKPKHLAIIKNILPSTAAWKPF